MRDIRKGLILAGFAVLAEEGYPGFTQHKVAARAGVRQSHLTYYFPTRLALLEAVASSAIEQQLARMSAAADIPDVVERIAMVGAALSQPTAIRVLVALVQSADKEPSIAILFRDLVERMLSNVDRVIGCTAGPEHSAATRIFHALSVGLAVVNLATARSDAQAITTETLNIALSLLRGVQLPAAFPASNLQSKGLKE
jgi:AcrR family transcriptional regulator